MATSNFYLDLRRPEIGGFCLRLNITHLRRIASYPLGVKLTKGQWDPKKKIVINHPRESHLNLFLSRRKAEIDAELFRLKDYEPEKLARFSATQLRDYLQERFNPEIAIEREKAREAAALEETRIEEERKAQIIRENSVGRWFEKTVRQKKGRTREIYQSTLNRLKNFCGEDLWSLQFEDLRRDWLLEFDDFLAQTAPAANSRAIHMRNLRHVCNNAIDEEVTTFYPFRRYKIESEITRKRDLDVATLRRIFQYEAPADMEWVQRYVDAFKLSFMLIGINMVDLCYLENSKGERVSYRRRKTGKIYDIKLEPETLSLLSKYRGSGQLLNYMDSCTDYRYFYNRLCMGLRRLRDELGLKELTSYYARHTWASIASELDIPFDTIRRALGHGGGGVTDIYIHFNMKKIDEANRRVFDWVFYGKR